MLVNDLWVALSRMRGSERVRIRLSKYDMVEALGVDYDADGVFITIVGEGAHEEELKKAEADCKAADDRSEALEAAIRTFIDVIETGDTWDDLPEHVRDAIDALEKVADDS